MYNEQLEQLIDAALADGVLTEKEKQILFKKAQSMGVDLDEFEMVLDARLVKLQKAEAEKSASSAPKSNKLGNVKKCPACDFPVQSYQGVCPECGYAFEGVDANRSSQALQKLVDSILQEQAATDSKDVSVGASILNNFSMSNAHNEMRKFERVRNAIQNFPVPNTKTDLMEFILSLKPKTKGMAGGQYADAYLAKYKECLDKARFMFPNDKDFAPILEASKLSRWGSMASTKKTLIIVGIFLAVFFIGIITLILLNH